VTDLDPALLAPVVREGDYRASLEAVRDRLAAFLDGLSDRQVVQAAPLAKQLTDVLAQLADLPVPDAELDSVENAAASVERILRSV